MNPELVYFQYLYIITLGQIVTRYANPERTLLAEIKIIASILVLGYQNRIRKVCEEFITEDFF